MGRVSGRQCKSMPRCPGWGDGGSSCLQTGLFSPHRITRRTVGWSWPLRSLSSWRAGTDKKVGSGRVSRASFPAKGQDGGSWTCVCPSLTHPKPLMAPYCFLGVFKTSCSGTQGLWPQRSPLPHQHPGPAHLVLVPTPPFHLMGARMPLCEPSMI